MLMDRIYVKSFLEMSYMEQAHLIEQVRTIRSSALNAAKVNSKKLTKSAIKNIAKGKTQGKTRKAKDPTKAATNALKKLSPDQIAFITKQLQATGD